MVALILALLEHPEQQTPVKRCLELAGHEVLFVDTFIRAKSVLKQHAFDLIISDVHLENGGSVFDFLKWVKYSQEGMVRNQQRRQRCHQYWSLACRNSSAYKD